MTREEAFEQIILWIRQERNYQALKWNYTAEPDDRVDDKTWWWNNGIANYWSRINLQTVATAQGRQAAAKIITTLVHMLEMAILKYGNLPKPGVTSGNIEEWDGIHRTPIQEP